MARRRAVKSVAQSELLGSVSRPSVALLDALGGGPTKSGARVGTQSALQVSTVFACIRNLAEDVAKLDFGVWKDDGKKGWEVAKGHPLHRLLRKPNPRLNSFTFHQMMIWSMLLRGTAYAVIFRDQRGRPTRLVPVMPDRVTVLMAQDGDLFYRIASSHSVHAAEMGGDSVTVPEEDMFVLHYATTDGIYGISPIGVAKESIGLSLVFEEYQARLFAQGARPSGVLTHPKTLSREAALRLKASWEQTHAGTTNSGRTALLEEGMKWEQLGMTSVDAEFLASRRFTVEEICRIFRMPPHMVGDLSRSTNNNIETQSLEYLNQTLMPILERFERGYADKFLPDETYVVEIDTAKLLRADLTTQIKAYSMGVANGIFTQNEARLVFGLNPKRGGDKLASPMNQGKPAGDGEGGEGAAGNGAGLPGDTDTGRER